MEFHSSGHSSECRACCIRAHSHTYRCALAQTHPSIRSVIHFGYSESTYTEHSLNLRGIATTFSYIASSHSILYSSLFSLNTYTCAQSVHSTCCTALQSTVYTLSNERESYNENENFDAGAMVLEYLTTYTHAISPRYVHMRMYVCGCVREREGERETDKCKNGVRYNCTSLKKKLYNRK